MGEQRRGHYLYGEWRQLCVPMERASLVGNRETLWLWCTKWGREKETEEVCTSWWLSCVSILAVSRQIVNSKSFLLQPWFCTDVHGETRKKQEWLFFKQPFSNYTPQTKIRNSIFLSVVAFSSNCQDLSYVYRCVCVCVCAIGSIKL